MQQFNKVIIAMGVHSNKKRLLIITEPKTIYFALPQHAVTNLMQETDYIIKQNECLVEHTIKNELSSLLSKHKHRNNIHEH